MRVPTKHLFIFLLLSIAIVSEVVDSTEVEHHDTTDDGSHDATDTSHDDTAHEEDTSHEEGGHHDFDLSKEKLGFCFLIMFIVLWTIFFEWIEHSLSHLVSSHRLRLLPLES